MANALGGLLQRFQQQEEAAKAANVRRYTEAMAIYDEIIARYRPGGEFGRAALGQLEQRKVRDVGKETQQLISSGLYGTTTMGATGRRWEEAVGGPERLKLEDIQMQRLSQAQVGKAGFIERREDIGPDPGLIAQLAMQAGQTYAGTPRTTRTTAKGPSPWEPGFMGGGWTLDGGYGGRAPTPAEPARGIRPAAGAREEAAPTEPVVTPGGYGAMYGTEGLPAGYRRTPTGAEPTGQMPAGFRKRGEPMVMAAKRWSKRKQPTKYGPPTPYYTKPSEWLGTKTTTRTPTYRGYPAAM